MIQLYAVHLAVIVLACFVLILYFFIWRFCWLRLTTPFALYFLYSGSSFLNYSPLRLFRSDSQA